jgi:regulator of sigma E protease
VGQAGDSAVDIGLILAATTQEPGVASWLLWKALAWLGVAGGLTFVIFVHELGHFLVAKACGVKCEKFYVGFDFFEVKIPFTPWRIPRSLIKFQRGETEYGIGSLPLGGYVKMLGQDDDPRNAEHEAARIRHAVPSAPEARVEAIAAGTSSEGIVDGQSVEKLTNEALAAHHGGQKKPDEPPVPATTTEGKTILLDPRSYPAKSVPARMAIISAGVIMNLIFAVIMAGVAFTIGVRELPATIGAVTPGSPAWVAGIVPGSKILRMGRRSQPYERLRFEELTTAVILNGYDRELPMLIRRPDGQEVEYSLRPSDRLKSLTKRPTVGVVHQTGREVHIRTGEATYLNPAATPPLEDKDKVVAIDGQPIEADWDINAILARKPQGSVTLSVERGGDTTMPSKGPLQKLSVVVQPKAMRGIGASMQIGPILAIRKGSPAEEAGFHVGDKIVQIDGEPVGDPLSLPQRLVPQDPSPAAVKIVVSRTDRQGAESNRTLTVTPEPPLQYIDDFLLGGPTAIESIGIAYAVTSTIAAIEAGSPAEKAGLQPGDVVTEAEFVPAGEKQRDVESKVLMREAFKPIVLDNNLKSWTYVFTRMQFSLPDTKLKLKFTRDGKPESATMDLEDATTYFDESRGLVFFGTSEIHRVETISEAALLGFRETVERVKEVVLSLHSLVTGHISMTNLSGPAGILGAAANFAEEGPSRLLMFLTMLSANLAVLNFLPIPALDGGHMLFLAAEGIRGKPVDERLQIRLTIFGVICLLSLMVFATAMDIGRFAEMIQEWFS